jgi:hypothetical protein
MALRNVNRRLTVENSRLVKAAAQAAEALALPSGK